MDPTEQAIEDGIRRFRALVEADSVLRDELLDSRGAFSANLVADDVAAGRGPIARRHLEWFLFERPSEGLGGVPVEVLAEPWLAASDDAGGDRIDVFLASRAGVFEVAGVEGAGEIRLRDLLGPGEHVVSGPVAAGPLGVGDLVVGRIFPLGDSLVRLSTAAGALRNPELAAALRSDVERLRSTRRGMLRMSQSQLEAMFFGPGADHDLAAADEARRAARGELVEAGLDAGTVDSILADLDRAARAPSSSARSVAVTDALDRLAFETSVELEHVRRVLIGLWSALTARPRAGAGGPPQQGCVPEEAVRRALERFDGGREGGDDLEGLFRTLEVDLGLQGEGGGEPDPAPDFPGVVGAMVEEFLWDVGREEGAPAAERHACLRKLGRFAASMGVFENLGRRELVDFTARWVLDEGEIASGGEARELLGALEAFCRWSEERQGLALWEAFGATLAALADSLPRLVEARRHCDGPRDEATLFELGPGDDPGTAVLLDAEGAAHEVELRGEIAGALCTGDLVLARIEGGGTARVSACYPGVLAELARP